MRLGSRLEARRGRPTGSSRCRCGSGRATRGRYAVRMVNQDRTEDPPTPALLLSGTPEESSTLVMSPRGVQCRPHHARRRGGQRSAGSACCASSSGAPISSASCSRRSKTTKRFRAGRRGRPTPPVDAAGRRFPAGVVSSQVHDEPTRGCDEPLPAAARRQPGRLAPVGRGSARARQTREQADPAVDRILGLPLVPRDGARVLRGPGGRRRDERRVRQHQGRPRRAPGPGPDLPDCACAADARGGRLAADGVPDAGRRALLRGHLLPEAGAPRAAGIPGHPAAHRRRLPRAGSGDRRAERAAVGGPAVARARARAPQRCRRMPAQWRSPSSSGPSMRWTAASAARPSFLTRPSSASACAHGSCATTTARSASCASRSQRWRPAASPTSSAAVSAATASTRSGRSRISRRCSTTTRRCSRCTPTRGARCGDGEFASVARDIVGWLVREMRAPDGAWYSSLDADSEGEEGRFYVFSREEAREAMSRRRMGRGLAALRLRRAAEFRAPRLAPARGGLRSRRSRSCSASRCPTCRRASSAPARRCSRARETRVRPGRDDKILTSWNALAIGALARAARAQDEPAWTDLALAALDALVATAWRDGSLLRDPPRQRRRAERVPRRPCVPARRADRGHAGALSAHATSRWRDAGRRPAARSASRTASTAGSGSPATITSGSITGPSRRRTTRRLSGNGVAAQALLALGHLAARAALPSRPPSARCGRSPRALRTRRTRHVRW